MTEPSFTASELAAMRLPGLPTFANKVRVRAAREGWAFVERRTNGGIVRCYLLSALPTFAQVVISERERGVVEPSIGELAADVDSVPDSHRDIARERVRVVGRVEELVADGKGVLDAIATACEGTPHAPRTVRRWCETCRGRARAEWFGLLVPRWSTAAAAPKLADVHPAAFAFFRDDYLRASKPSYRACYRRTLATAEANGWTPIPSYSAMVRRFERDVPASTRILRREGRDALERVYPAQERTRDHLGALEAVTADGHKFDVLVRWPGIAEPVRVMMVAYQDLYSGKILSWRVGRSESFELARLALADLVTTYGIPEHVYLDNGRAWASKKMTGGAPTRHRFAIKEEDPEGIMLGLGVRVHWTTPYHGQSKPIERAFGDLCENVAKHPAFEGAYTGRNTVEKPANYGSRAVELADFLRVLTAQIREHNARGHREAKACAGRSFDETFAESYAARPITKPSEAQARLLLLAAEGVTVRHGTASLFLAGNRYWSDALIPLMGERVVARFDPDALKKGVHVYRVDGRYVGFADCVEAVGFDDMSAARDHLRRRRLWVKAQTKAAQLGQQFSAEELAAMHLRAQGAPEPPQSSRVVKAVFGSRVAQAPVVKMQREVDEQRERERLALEEDVGASDFEQLAKKRRAWGA
jgi:putative transposase